MEAQAIKGRPAYAICAKHVVGGREVVQFDGLLRGREQVTRGGGHPMTVSKTRARRRPWGGSILLARAGIRNDHANSSFRRCGIAPIRGDRVIAGMTGGV